MTRSARIVLRVCCLLAVCAVGCRRTDAPLPFPDAAGPSGLGLSVIPDSLAIRPASSGRITFFLRDEQDLPVPDYPLDFAIVGNSNGDGTADARLSSDRGLTDSNGSAVVEVIVGNLATDNRPVTFSVSATYQGAALAQAYITVTASSYSVAILPVPAQDLLGSVSVVTARLLFYDNTRCADLDLTNLKAAPTKPWPERSANVNQAPEVFRGVAVGSSDAVVGLGLDSSSVVQIGGCVDILGRALLESEIVRATLYLDHLFPVLGGTYQVASNFPLSPAPSVLATIQSAWQQWARCPLDPARLWIDCTLDALVTSATSDPLDCVPVPGEEGSLGNLLFPHRGTAVTPLAGTTASASDTPCHGQADSTGNASLESIVDALFDNTRGQLSGAKLGTLPGEIASLLAHVRIDSQMTITAGNDVNGYSVEHDLLNIIFPDALSPTSLKVATLGLPVSSVSGIPATFRAGQLSFLSHGFTLRLGTTSRYAFEATSIKSRGAADAGSLVKTIFDLARRTNQGTTLTGCSALDAAACELIQQDKGCLLDACQRGLAALAAKLAEQFNLLDGRGLDFVLSGSAPVVDLDGDRRADALGLDTRTGSLPASPGVWSAALGTRAGSYSTYGSWTASRVTSAP